MTRELAAVLQELFDAGVPVIAFNASYDFTVLAAESARYGVPQLSRFPVLDPYIMNKQVDRYRKGKRTLTALCEEYGVSLDNAHTSAADALATLRMLDAMAGKFPKLRMPASQLHQLQVDWAAAQAADFQSYLRKTKPAAVIEGDWPVLPPEDASRGRLLARARPRGRTCSGKGRPRDPRHSAMRITRPAGPAGFRAAPAQFSMPPRGRTSNDQDGSRGNIMQQFRSEAEHYAEVDCANGLADII